MLDNKRLKISRIDVCIYSKLILDLETFNRRQVYIKRVKRNMISVYTLHNYYQYIGRH